MSEQIGPIEVTLAISSVHSALAHLEGARWTSRDRPLSRRQIEALRKERARIDAILENEHEPA